MVQSLKLSLVGNWNGVAEERNASASVMYQVLEIMKKQGIRWLLLRKKDNKQVRAIANRKLRGKPRASLTAHKEALDSCSGRQRKLKTRPRT